MSLLGRWRCLSWRGEVWRRCSRWEVILLLYGGTGVSILGRRSGGASAFLFCGLFS